MIIFIVECSQIRRRAGKVLASEHWWTAQVCAFVARSKFLNFISKARSRDPPSRTRDPPLQEKTPSVQIPQTHFHCNSVQSKKVFIFSRASALVVCCSSQNRSSSLMSPEWIDLTKTSNWAHEVTSVDSSTWKQNIADAMVSFIIWSYIFRYTGNAPLNLVAGKRYSSHFCLTTLSKKQSYYSQQIGFHKRFSNRLRFFPGKFQARVHMKPVFLLTTSGKISLWRFKLASWRRQNSKRFVACWKVLALNAVWTSKVSQTRHWKQRCTFFRTFAFLVHSKNRIENIIVRLQLEYSMFLPDCWLQLRHIISCWY